jgi:hypothetical protein
LLTPAQDDKNNDECAACGEGGKLVCCDGCENSLHFNCIDPPISADDLAALAHFFCRECMRKKARSGAFKGLTQLIYKKDGEVETSFQLPKSATTKFAKIHAGPNGEYVDDAERRIQ